TGALSQTYGWHYGFGFAGVGMLVGLLIYQSGARYFAADIRQEPRHVRPPPLAPGERRAAAGLGLLLPVLSLLWIAQTQVWNTYNLWARDHLELEVLGWQMPVPWLQAFDGLAAVALVPPVLLFWRWQARRSAEPDELTKLSIGCLIFGVSLVWL